MANKTIINSPPPSPSKRIIGGSNQRSKVRFGLQNSNQWRYNHAPLDSDESKNATWWQEQAERYETKLSSSGDILYARQAVKTSLNREVDRGRIYNLDTTLDKTFKGGSNQPFNKKHRLNNIAFGLPESEIDIADDLYPNIKKRSTIKAILNGKTFVGEQILPFSAFSSSIVSGYQSALSASGYTNVDFANLHNDKIQPYGGEIPLQGPFTERFVGGIQARHNAPLMTTGRKEQFSLSLDGGFAIATITISTGGGAFNTTNYNTKNVTLSLGGVSFEAELDNTADMSESTESVTGIQDATSITDVASSLVTSINAGATNQNLRVSAYNLGSVIIITTTIPGPSINGTLFAGTLIASAYGSTSAFAGGRQPSAGINEISGPNPRGQYLRGQAAKAPVNIQNIKTLFTSDSVRVVGNFTRNYEIVQGSDRLATNMDLAFNPENYAFTIPTAFVTTPTRRALGLTGSADYPAPRQIASRRTNQTIIVNRFSAPGGKLVSKQQFRDVASDQLSSNNALPFRNLGVRLPYNKQLSVHNAFGGLVPGTDTPSIYKTQRNQTRRLETSGNTFVTGTVFDNYFVTRPIPAGDSTQWFFSLSGSNTPTYSEYVLNGNKYPENITRTRNTIASSIGAGAFSWIDGNSYYLWSTDPYSAPWSQLQSAQKSAANHLRKQNIYELLPKQVVSKDTIRNVSSTKTRTYKDQAGNSIVNDYSEQFIEPPITSRYKPLVHQIETFIGSPSETSNEKITLNLEYSYGNSLMGFANRELNKEIAGNTKFLHNRVKRPYEVLREQLNSSSDRSLNGINMIKMFAYEETIYPKEIYTYLSGSRARLSYSNSFWKDDAKTLSTVVTYLNYSSLFYIP